MSEKCFLKYCNATVGDCKAKKCQCLSCDGKKQDTCKILKNGKRLGVDFLKMVCSKCKNYNGK